MKQLMLRLGTLLAIPLLAASFITFTPKAASAQAEPYLGQISSFGFNFCPRGWSDTHGQLLPIAQNSALFSLLGTMYGGDGRSTFALPDLRGRIIMDEGTGPGLSPVAMGEKGGLEVGALVVANLAPHNHLVNVTNSFATKGGPGNDYLASGNDGHFQYHDGPTNRTMEHDMISDTGGGAPFAIRNPFLGVKVCIAVTGIYPSRS